MRIRHIKSARQRYKMVAELDEEGRPKRVPVNRTARGGRQVTRPVKHADKNQPLPPRNCESCGKPIEIGTPMKICTIRRQFGATHLFRHESCPTWQEWEVSNSLSARIAQIQSMTFDVDGLEPDGDTSDAVADIIEAIRELQSEKEESLSNMPEGLQQGDTGQQLQEAVDNLESWASELESIDLPEAPEAHCANCGGEEITHDEHTDECPEDCDGTEECLECNGADDAGELTEEQLDEWREEARQAIQDALDNVNF